MTGFPGREDDYRSRMTADEDAVSFEDRGRAAIRASSQYLADPSTSLQDAHAAIKLLQLALSDVIMVAESRKNLLRQYRQAPAGEERTPLHPT